MSATPSHRFCHARGRLIDAHGALPTAAFEVVGEPPHPDIGCNQLACARCGQPLRSIAGMLPVHALDPIAGERLFTALGAASLTPAVAKLLEPDERFRLYVCACGTTLAVGRGRFIDEHDDFDLPAPRDWACAGHPELEVPGHIDGEAIPSEHADAWRALAAGALAGTRAIDRPGYLKSPPAAWCLRMVSLLLPRPEGIALGQAIGELVLGADVEVANLAIGFFMLMPLAPGAEALDQLVLADGPRTAADDLVLLTLSERLKRLPDGAARPTLAAAWRAQTWKNSRRVVLLEALVARDLATALANVPLLLGVKGERAVIRAMLLGAHRAQGDPGVIRLVRRMCELGRSEVFELERLASENLPPELAARVATELTS